MKLRVPRLEFYTFDHELPSELDQVEKGKPTDVLDPEAMASEILGMRQFQVENIEPGTNIEMLPDAIENCFMEILREQGVYPLNKGVPDLLVWKEGRAENFFFVEVKRSDGVIQRSQIEWIEEFDFKTYVAYVDFETYTTGETDD